MAITCFILSVSILKIEGEGGGRVRTTLSPIFSLPRKLEFSESFPLLFLLLTQSLETKSGECEQT